MCSGLHWCGVDEGRVFVTPELESLRNLGTSNGIFFSTHRHIVKLYPILLLHNHAFCPSSGHLYLKTWS